MLTLLVKLRKMLLIDFCFILSLLLLLIKRVTLPEVFLSFFLELLCIDFPAEMMLPCLCDDLAQS